jgi:hypothetical protein
MRRATAFGAAVVLTMSLAIVAGADVNYERIKTKVEFRGIEVNGSEATFFGKLKSRKPACVKRRRGLYVHYVGDLGVVGNDRTDRKGRWEFTVDSSNLQDGEYDATIRAAVVFKDGEKRFKCRGGRGTFVTDDF